MAAPELALILLGAVVALDQMSIAQIQLAHPLIAGTLAGFIAGGAMGAGAGALVGSLLGLILAGERPVGGVIPPDGGPAAVVAAAALGRALPEAAGPSGEGLALALLAGLALAVIGRGTESWARRRNLDLLRHAASVSTPQAVERAVAGAITLAAIRGGMTVAAGLPLASALLARARYQDGLDCSVVVAVAGGVGLAAQGRLLGARPARGFVLAGLGALLAATAAIPGLWAASRR